MRSSKSFRFLNSIICGLISLYFDVLEKTFFDRIMKTHVEFQHLFCRRLVRPAYVTFFKNWSMKLKCPNLRNAQIPSFWPKSCFLLASEVFKVYQIRSKDPVCKAFSRVSKTEQFRENHASFDFTKYTLLQKYTQFCLS